jgi:photoactive yellow protein
MTRRPDLDVDMPDLVAAVEKLSPEQFDLLPFGAIRLDAEFKVVFYSNIERRQSGFRKEAFGRPFFLEIAPCLNTVECRDRIEKALARGTLDISFDHMTDLPSGARDVELQVRVLAASGGGCWIFTKLVD